MRAMTRPFRLAVALGVSLLFVAAWAFPILWSVLNSLKTEQDILAYPPKLIFTPTLAAYRDVLFGSGSILPNLWSSLLISAGTTVITMLLAIPAAYALARLRISPPRTLCPLVREPRLDAPCAPTGAFRESARRALGAARRPHRRRQDPGGLSADPRGAGGT